MLKKKLQQVKYSQPRIDDRSVFWAYAFYSQ